MTQLIPFEGSQLHAHLLNAPGVTTNVELSSGVGVSYPILSIKGKNRLGYSLTMALFCAFLLRVLGKQPWWLTVVLTLAGSFGTAYIFRQLQVILPGGILGI